MIVREKISADAIETPFSKAVVDVARKAVALGCELHMDCAEELIRDGAVPADVWGCNIYPDGHLDFISLVNVKPAQGNRTMDVQDPALRAAIENIVKIFLQP